MNQHPNDPGEKDPLLQVIVRATDLYHSPPETPREAMWEAIQSKRRGRRPALRVIFGSPRVWIPAAAAAVLVVGFLAGRVSVPDTNPELVAVGDQGAPAATPDEVGHREPDPTATRPPGLAARPEGSGDAAYRMAASNFLGRTETMLTRFQNTHEPGAPGTDADFAQWARILLTETRLLIDSPAAKDPEMRRLLGDLETLLAQLVLLSDGRQSGQRSWIADSMDRSGILLRMRSKIPNPVPFPGI